LRSFTSPFKIYRSVQKCAGIVKKFEGAENHFIKHLLNPKTRQLLVSEGKRWARVAKVVKSIGLSPLT